MSDVFETEIGFLIKFFAKKKKGVNPKKNNRIITKLSSISPEIK